MTPRIVALLGTVLAALSAACAPTGSEAAAPATPPQVQHARLDAPRQPGQAPTVSLSPEAVQRLGITLAPVEERPMPLAIEVPGECAIPPGRRLVVSAPFAAELQPLGDATWEIGARRQGGSALIGLAQAVPPDREILSRAERVQSERVDVDLELARANAEGRLATARARVDVARRALDRAEALVAEDAGSVRALDSARAEHAYAQAELTSATAALDVLEAASGDAPPQAPVPVALEAPISGTITAVFAAQGQIVPAGASLCELSQLDELWVRADLREDERASLLPGSPASVRPLGRTASGSERAGREISGPPTANPLAGTVSAWYAIDNSDGAYQPGQRVVLTVEMTEETTSTVVPFASILFDTHAQPWVYVSLGAGQYSRARVELSRIAGELAVLARGPRPGEQVVVAGAAELYGAEYEGGK